jgi:hypothetical protein
MLVEERPFAEVVARADGADQPVAVGDVDAS